MSVLRLVVRSCSLLKHENLANSNKQKKKIKEAKLLLRDLHNSKKNLTETKSHGAVQHHVLETSFFLMIKVLVALYFPVSQLR